MSLTLWNDDFFLKPFDLALPLSKSNNSLTKDLMPLMGTDLIESEKDYKVHVDLPGVNPEDLEVTISDNNKYLCLKAERNSTHEEKTDKVHSMERQFGRVQRKIHIPNNADMENIETNMKNGVLTITMPKKAKAAEPEIRKLQINVEK
jgi:HSP20 family protein